MSDLKNELSKIEELVNQKMADILPEEVEGRIGENRISRAMRYSALSGGKRIRPFLLVQSASLFGVDKECALQTAAAIEMVHAFSLIHDDLPALDNDDFRRGKPSLHKEFDEATAILAGDALLSYAFEVLAHESTHRDSFVRCELIAAFAKAIGINGMIGGQMIDMISEERELSFDQITRLQKMKTGELFRVSCDAGAILGKAPHSVRNSLRGYSTNIGLVFQITDDLLDATTETNKDGSPRLNKSEEKGTYIAAMGKEKAMNQAEILTKQAIEHLNSFGKKADLLKELANNILKRTR